MRIDSMDASNYSLIKSQENSPVIKGESVGVVEAKAQDLKSRNITLMTAQEKLELPISDKVVIEAIEKANRAISGANRRFEFSIHEKTKQIMIKVINSDTEEIVREIPPEKILDMVASMWESAGILVDERR